jgi:hypothetical protein
VGGIVYESFSKRREVMMGDKGGRRNGGCLYDLDGRVVFCKVTSRVVDRKEA